MEITKERLAGLIGASLLAGKVYSLSDQEIDALSDEIIALGASVEDDLELAPGIKALIESAKARSYSERARADNYLDSIG